MPYHLSTGERMKNDRTGRTLARPPATGRELRAWRKAWGLSQLQVEELTGATQSTISRAESSPSPPGPLARVVWLLGALLPIERRHLEALEEVGGYGDTPTHRALRELAGTLGVLFPGGSTRPIPPEEGEAAPDGEGAPSGQAARQAPPVPGSGGGGEEGARARPGRLGERVKARRARGQAGGEEPPEPGPGPRGVYVGGGG